MLPCLVTIETPIIGELADVMSELQHPYHISNLQCMADCSSSSKLNSPLPACVKTNSNSSIARLNWVHVNSDWSLSSVNPWVIGSTVVWRPDTWIILFHFNFCSSFQQVFGDVTSAWKTFTWTSMLWKLWKHTHTHTQTIYRLTQTQNTTASTHILRSSDTNASSVARVDFGPYIWEPDWGRQGPHRILGSHHVLGSYHILGSYHVLGPHHILGPWPRQRPIRVTLVTVSLALTKNLLH